MQTERYRVSNIKEAVLSKFYNRVCLDWEKLNSFDQTTLWWLLEKEKDIKVGTFKDNLRWNYYHGYEELKLFPKQQEIIKHYSYAAPK